MFFIPAIVATRAVIANCWLPEFRARFLRMDRGSTLQDVWMTPSNMC